jgi:hypothetical protein
MHLYSREQAINVLIAMEYQRAPTAFNPREKTGTQLWLHFVTDKNAITFEL